MRKEGEEGGGGGEGGGKKMRREEENEKGEKRRRGEKGGGNRKEGKEKESDGRVGKVNWGLIKSGIRGEVRNTSFTSWCPSVYFLSIFKGLERFTRLRVRKFGDLII